MSRVLACVVAAFLFLDVAQSNAASSDTCKNNAKEVTSFGRTFYPALSVDKRDIGKLLPVEHGIANLQVAATRILLAVRPETRDRTWRITIRNAGNGVLASFDALDFQDAAGQLSLKRWTGRFDEAKVLIELQAPSTTDVVVDVHEGQATPSSGESVRLYSIQGSIPNWQALYTVPLHTSRVGDPVGMLVTGQAVPAGEKTAPSWCCSGTMLTHDLFITNWHCGAAKGSSDEAYWLQPVCDRAVIDIGWANASLSRQFGCKEIAAQDRSLDYAILRVAPVLGPAGQTSRPPRSRLARVLPSAGQDIFMVHHAKCSQKLISKDCRVRDARRSAWTSASQGADGSTPAFTHDCDTESGASGGPVFDTAGEVIGIHHAGFETNDRCESDRVNKATSIVAIRDHLEKHFPAIANELGGL